MITYENANGTVTHWYTRDDGAVMEVRVDGMNPAICEMNIITAVKYARAYVAGLSLKDAADGIRGRKYIHAKDVVAVEITGW